MEYRIDSLSLSLFRRGIVDAFRFMSIFLLLLLLPRSRGEKNEPRSRLVHERVGGWWLSDLTLHARAGRATERKSY